MRQDLTRGSIVSGLMRFCLPLIAGNLLQQMYNIVDTWVVGQYLGQEALAAVGSAFSLLVLLTSVILGLCMGAGVVFSQLWGARDVEGMRRAMGNALLLIAGAALTLTLAACLLLEPILRWMNIPASVAPGLRLYLRIVLPGMLATFVYNYLAAAVRSVGNSVTPLIFLAVSTLSNIVLDLLTVTVWHMGIAGIALATLFSQLLSAIGLAVYALIRMRDTLPERRHLRPDPALLSRIARVSALTSLQQSIMNFGILMIQSLVNSFGVTVMAAFAACVKIDAFAYAPAQDFANGYATFISQNTGAKKPRRVRQGVYSAFGISLGFCAAVSALVGLFAEPLMGIFIAPGEQAVIDAGVRYLRIEGLCYVGIGALFLFYATYRGVERAGMSVVLTVISLGLRVLLAYTFAPRFGVDAIWWAIPIGWLAADLVGLAGLPGLFRFQARSADTAAPD